jgi:hypothetical protein
MITKTQRLFMAGFLFLLSFPPPAHCEDSEVTRRTLAGLKGVRVLVETMQPNVLSHAQKAGVTTVQLHQAIEDRLHAAGIKTLAGDDWLKAKGHPILYVNINTHETEKYWYAYDIKLELRQIVLLESDPRIKALADTWSINITGEVNIGNLKLLNKATLVLVESFIQAYKTVSQQK